MPDIKVDDTEKARRVRSVAEWILDDWSSKDIINNIVNKWHVGERQAKRYIKEARAEYIDISQEAVDQMRRQKIESLKKLKRSLKQEYIGTPKGISAIIRIEREIIKLQGLQPTIKLEVSGKDGKPIQTETTHKVVFENYGE